MEIAYIEGLIPIKHQLMNLNDTEAIPVTIIGIRDIPTSQAAYDKPMAEQMGRTRSAATSTISAPEREPSRRVSFAEAVKLLDGKLDLESARSEMAKSHRQWGIFDALNTSGAMKDVSLGSYKALFDQATIDEADLKKICEAIERGEKILPIFDSGILTLDELFDTLFGYYGGIPVKRHGEAYDHLRDLRKIDPKDIPDLQNLHEKSDDEQMAAFEEAYRKAKPLEPTGPRILFTPDTLRLDPKNALSATQNMQALAKGGPKLIDPAMDLIRIRTQIDAGLDKFADEHFGKYRHVIYLPNGFYKDFVSKAFEDTRFSRFIPDYQEDEENYIAYSNYALEDGCVLNLRFAPFAHPSYATELRLLTSDPTFHNGNRIALG